MYYHKTKKKKNRDMCKILRKIMSVKVEREKQVEPKNLSIYNHSCERSKNSLCRFYKTFTTIIFIIKLEYSILDFDS